MEWRKYKKYIFKRHSIKISKRKKKSEYINSMTQDSTCSFSILYLLIRTSKTFDRKMFSLFWSCVNVLFFFSSRLGTAECNLSSTAQVLCASLPAHFPAHELFRSQCESVNSFLVLGGCSCTCSFLSTGEGLVMCLTEQQSLNPFGSDSGWTFHIKNHLYDCYHVK